MRTEQLLNVIHSPWIVVRRKQMEYCTVRVGFINQNLEVGSTSDSAAVYKIASLSSRFTFSIITKSILFGAVFYKENIYILLLSILSIFFFQARIVQEYREQYEVVKQHYNQTILLYLRYKSRESSQMEKTSGHLEIMQKIYFFWFFNVKWAARWN